MVSDFSLIDAIESGIIRYVLPGPGNPSAAPDRTVEDRHRTLLVISPELADVFAAVISRIRGRDGALCCVASYDSHERVWNPPMPLLFQRRFGIEHRAIPAATIREWISRALDGSNVTDAGGQSLRFTPHDFRRMFVTDRPARHAPAHRPTRRRTP